MTQRNWKKSYNKITQDTIQEKTNSELRFNMWSSRRKRKSTTYPNEDEPGTRKQESCWKWKWGKEIVKAFSQKGVIGREKKKHECTYNGIISY